MSNNLFNCICQPKEYHSHQSRLLQFHSVCNANCYQVITMYWCGRLWVSHLFKSELKNVACLEIHLQHNSPHKHYHHGVLFAPPTMSIQWISPLRRMGGLTNGLAQGAVTGFYTNQYIKHLIYLFLELLVFSTNHLPAVKNGDQNSIHRRRRAPI